MQKLKTIIVENDPKSLSLLLSLIEDYCPELKVVSTSTNKLEAVKQILNYIPDLIFLDIELDDGSGFDILYQIPHIQFKTIIISGFSHYAFDAFKFEITHYLLKPVCIRDLRIAVDRVLQHSNTKENQVEEKGTTEQSLFSQKKIQISANKGIQLINLDEIEYFQADGSYTNIHFTNKEIIMASGHLKCFEFVLSERRFYRIGRTYILNLDQIKVYNKHGGGYITMKSGGNILLPRRKKDEFLQYLNSYLKVLN